MRAKNHCFQCIMNNFYIIKNAFLYKLTNSGSPCLYEKTEPITSNFHLQSLISTTGVNIVYVSLVPTKPLWPFRAWMVDFGVLWLAMWSRRKWGLYQFIPWMLGQTGILRGWRQIMHIGIFHMFLKLVLSILHYCWANCPGGRGNSNYDGI